METRVRFRVARWMLALYGAAALAGGAYLLSRPSHRAPAAPTAGRTAPPPATPLRAARAVSVRLTATSHVLHLHLPVHWRLASNDRSVAQFATADRCAHASLTGFGRAAREGARDSAVLLLSQVLGADYDPTGTQIGRVRLGRLGATPLPGWLAWDPRHAVAVEVMPSGRRELALVLHAWPDPRSSCTRGIDGPALALALSLTRARLQRDRLLTAR
jgi:hypothetical protein